MPRKDTYRGSCYTGFQLSSRHHLAATVLLRGKTPSDAHALAERCCSKMLLVSSAEIIELFLDSHLDI